MLDYNKLRKLIEIQNIGFDEVAPLVLSGCRSLKQTFLNEKPPGQHRRAIIKLN